MHETRLKISWRLRHPSYTWEEIINYVDLHSKLGSKHNVGDSPRGSPHKTYQETYCSFRLHEETCYVDDALEQVLAKILVYQDFIDRFVETGGHSELFIGVFNEENSGFTLDLDLLSKCLELKTELSFDVY